MVETRPKKHLLMGFSTNLPARHIRVFVDSFRAVYGPDEADVVIITNAVDPDAGFEPTAVQFQSTPSCYSRTMPQALKALLRGASFLHRVPPFRSMAVEASHFALIEAYHHPHFARWFAYRRVMKVMPRYDRVFFADVKDVVFQDRFFDKLTPGAICAFEDEAPYGDPDNWNDRWYRTAHGEAAYRDVVGRTPLCIGTIGGEHAVMDRLLDGFCAEIARSPFGKIEQAIFNRLYLTGQLPGEVSVFPNDLSSVATLGNDAIAAEVAVDGQVLTRESDGAVIPVVHMFDRHPRLNEAVTARYG
ncbi:MAG: hypothetical protein AAGG47_20480 [Pseudomonadota bacterium]